MGTVFRVKISGFRVYVSDKRFRVRGFGALSLG